MSARDRIVAAANEAGWVGTHNDPSLSIIEMRKSTHSRRELRVYFSVTGAVISGNREYPAIGSRMLPRRDAAQAALDFIAGKPYVMRP